MLGYLVTLHLLCLLVLFSLSAVIGPLCTGLAVLLLAVSFSYCYKHHYRLAGKRCVRQIWMSDEHCVLYRADGREIKLDVAGRHYVSSWLIVVELGPRVAIIRKRLVLFSDAAPFEQLRRLRVRLRFPVSDSVYNYRG